MIIFIASIFSIEFNKNRGIELLKSFMASTLTGNILVASEYGIFQLIKIFFSELGTMISNIINGSIGSGATLGTWKIAIKYFDILFDEKEALIFLIERTKIIRCFNETINKLNEYSYIFKNYNHYSEIVNQYL